jgi:hypothetical protein
MYLLLHETISFHDLFFVGLAALRGYISEAFPGGQSMHSQQNSMVRAYMTLNPDYYNLFLFLCASAGNNMLKLMNHRR